MLVLTAGKQQIMSVLKRLSLQRCLFSGARLQRVPTFLKDADRAFATRVLKNSILITRGA